MEELVTFDNFLQYVKKQIRKTKKSDRSQAKIKITTKKNMSLIFNTNTHIWIFFMEELQIG